MRVFEGDLDYQTDDGLALKNYKYFPHKGASPQVGGNLVLGGDGLDDWIGKRVRLTVEVIPDEVVSLVGPVLSPAAQEYKIALDAVFKKVSILEDTNTCICIGVSRGRCRTYAAVIKKATDRVFPLYWKRYVGDENSLLPDIRVLGES